MKILVACSLPDAQLTALRSLGSEVTVCPEITSDALPEALREVAVLIVDRLRVPPESIRSAETLQMIVRVGADVSNIAVDEASNLGIFVTHCPQCTAASIAELALGMLIGLDRGAFEQICAVRGGSAPRPADEQARGLAGMTLGLLGIDPISVALAERARACSMRVLAWTEALLAPHECPPGIELCNARPELGRRCEAIFSYAPDAHSASRRPDAKLLRSLPDGALVAEPAGRVDTVADFVVVGSGAGGATCAVVLAEAGREVLVLEEGRHRPPEARTLSMADAMRETFRDFGCLAAEGRILLPILQGRVVGGTTAINAGIIWRLPETVHAAWLRADPRLAEALPWADLERHFEAIERDLGIGPMRREVLGLNNLLMEKGIEALGWEGRIIRRNAPTCQGTGACVQMCPGGHKASMDQSYLPRAMRAGARVVARCRVERIVRHRGQWQVRGTLRDPVTGRVTGTLRAMARRGVVLAASTLGTPAILRRSRLGNHRVGEGLMGHPGTALLAEYAAPVRQWDGVHQGFECVQFRDRGYKLESLGLPPEMTATRVPGMGRAWARMLERLPYTSQWAVAATCEARGSVRPRGRGGLKVRYCPTPADARKLGEGLRALAEIAFAAGAVRVYPNVHGAPPVLTSPDQLDTITDAARGPEVFGMVMTHLMSACAIGSDADRFPVGLDFQVRGAPGVYVADSSLLPTNLGVNPQHTIMAVARQAAERMAG